MKILLELLLVLTILSPTAAIICATKLPPIIPDEMTADCADDPTADNKFCAWFELYGNRYAGCSTKGADGCKKDGDFEIIISGHKVTAHCCSYDYCNKAPRMYVNDMPEMNEAVKADESVQDTSRHLSLGPVVIGKPRSPQFMDGQTLGCNPKNGALCGLKSIPKGIFRNRGEPDKCFFGILRGVSLKQTAIISLISIILFSCFLIACQLVRKGFSGKRYHLKFDQMHPEKSGFVPLENEKPVD